MVIGLAETAICLEQTLHEELRSYSERDDVCFIHTTRREIDADLLCRFEEPHSHASAHLQYRPQIPETAPQWHDRDTPPRADHAASLRST